MDLLLRKQIVDICERLHTKNMLAAADGNVADGWDVDEVRMVKGDYAVGFTNNTVEGFELGLGDWSAERGTWEVGVPGSGPMTNALGRRAYAGTNCAATVLGGVLRVIGPNWRSRRASSTLKA